MLPLTPAAFGRRLGCRACSIRNCTCNCSSYLPRWALGEPGPLSQITSQLSQPPNQLTCCRRRGARRWSGRSLARRLAADRPLHLRAGRAARVMLVPHGGADLMPLSVSLRPIPPLPSAARRGPLSQGKRPVASAWRLATDGQTSRSGSGFDDLPQRCAMPGGHPFFCCAGHGCGRPRLWMRPLTGSQDLEVPFTPVLSTLQSI